MDIRAAELTADHVGRMVKIDPGDQTSLVGRLVSVRHKRVGRVPRRRLRRSWNSKSRVITASERDSTASAWLSSCRPRTRRPRKNPTGPQRRAQHAPHATRLLVRKRTTITLRLSAE